MTRGTYSRIEYRPWRVWEGAVTPYEDKRSSHTFRASVANTLLLLIDELEWLGAASAVLETGHLPNERVKSGAPHGSYHLGGTGRDGVRLSFVGTGGPLQFATDRFYGWDTNLRAIALGLKALRAVDRYGIAQAAQQYAGWAQLPAGSAPMTDRRAVDIITRYADLPEGVPVVVTKAWRAAVRRAHPDANGGRTEAWSELEPAGRHLGLL